jgi:hypothetical protein
MRYLLLIYQDEKAVPAKGSCAEEHLPLLADLKARGKLIAAHPLHDTATATSVRVRGGKALVTDGPFAETKEQLGGFYMIEAKDLDEAVEVAGRIPSARDGTIEVRPIFELDSH